jgi:hypothetical protein
MRTLIAFVAIVFSFFPKVGRAASNVPGAMAVMAEFDRITAGSRLWPGFEPQRIPVEIYDGRQTWLFRHPHPPEGFKELPEHKGVFVSPGRHASARANTGVQVGGVDTATVTLNSSNASLREQAAQIVHECFHVFQRERHPKWSANEADLFLYPVDNPGLLLRRREESESLRRALLARDSNESMCWIAEAVRVRDLRFAALPANDVAYERMSELNEGLANYVEVLAAGKKGSFNLPALEFVPEAVRQRSYRSGTALALLLDRIAPGWQAQLDAGAAGSLDQLLSTKVYFASAPCQFSDPEEAALLSRARADISAFKQRRRRERDTFLAAKGWQLTIKVDPQYPLLAKDFDPLNFVNFGDGEVLHTRWIKLSNDDGTVEVLDQKALTQSAGTHPLFNGVREVTITGLPKEPVIRQSSGSVQVTAEGVHADFRHAMVHLAGQRIMVEISQPAGSQ